MSNRHIGPSRRQMLTMLGLPAAGMALPAVANPHPSGPPPGNPVMGVMNGVINVKDPIYAGGAKGDGTTDDTAAIQGAINAASADNVVYFPTGVYVTSAPLVITQGGVTLLGSGPLATMGAGGSGVGKFTPGTAGTITREKRYGSVIAPSSSWTQGSAVSPGAIVFDGSASELDKCTIERMWIDGNNAGTTTLHGIVGYGNLEALSVVGCGVMILYGESSNGIYLQSDGSKEPQGSHIERDLLQFIGHNGIEGAFGDSDLVTCHTQNVGNYGLYIHKTVQQGGDVRVTDCRCDLGLNGFVVDMPCGAFLGMVQIENCATQRNQDNGYYILAQPGEIKTCPVYLSNCVAQGDGVAGGTGAGYTISGPVVVSMSNCACHVNTIDVTAGCPPYAVVTTSGGAANPCGVSIQGGFYNAVTEFSDVIDAPGVASVSCMTFTGAQWNQNTPTLTTSL